MLRIPVAAFPVAHNLFENRRDSAFLPWYVACVFGDTDAEAYHQNVCFWKRSPFVPIAPFFVFALLLPVSLVRKTLAHYLRSRPKWGRSVPTKSYLASRAIVYFSPLSGWTAYHLHSSPF